MPDEDRGIVRTALLPTISAAPAPLRVHIASALNTVVRCDYPDAWPTLLDELCKLLASGDEAQMYAGVRALLETVRAFRFSDTDKKLEEVVSRTFPTLLASTKALLDTQTTESNVGELVYFALKAYKMSIILSLIHI